MKMFGNLSCKILTYGIENILRYHFGIVTRHDYRDIICVKFKTNLRT